ncbi:MAG: hypothetical protein J0M33_21975 [Anaerolineae bacterium]|nr:hypothetical protein [Anaerolineae bacterium]
MDSSQSHYLSSMWTTELNDYCLVDLGNDKDYVIYQLSTNALVIIEEDDVYFYTIDQLLLAGARVITSLEELQLLTNRPFRPWGE